MRGVGQLLRLQLASLDQTTDMLTREAKPIRCLLGRKRRILVADRHRDRLVGIEQPLNRLLDCRDLLLGIQTRSGSSRHFGPRCCWKAW
jgi:hypothetical protein